MLRRTPPETRYRASSPAAADLAPRAQVTADFRTNSLIVQASPGDVADVAALVSKLDTPTSDAVNELRVFSLEHSLAQDVYATLQYAIGAQMPGGGRPGAGRGGAGRPRWATKWQSAMLRFVTVDAKGQKILNSGILTDVRITPDMRSNSILVSAPADSMDLIGALIQQLDERPAATAAIKVFTIVNADVGDLVNMLNAVFGQATTGFQAGNAQAGGVKGKARSSRSGSPTTSAPTASSPPARKAISPSSKQSCCGWTKATRGNAKPPYTA